MKDYTKIIIVGEKNGRFVVIDKPYKKCGYWKVKIKCECGNEQYVPCEKWIKKKYKKCRPCQLVGSENYDWSGYGEINGHTFCVIEGGAKSRKLKFDVSKEYLWNLFLKQERKCALSGLPLQFTINKSEKTASLDRIDNDKGYVEGNVQWIHKSINIMKNGFEEEDFLRFCKIIYEYNRDRIQGGIENISNRRIV